MGWNQLRGVALLKIHLHAQLSSRSTKSLVRQISGINIIHYAISNDTSEIMARGSGTVNGAGGL